MQCFVDGSTCDKNPCEGLGVLNAGACRFCEKIESNRDQIGRFLSEIGIGRPLEDDEGEDLYKLVMSSETMLCILTDFDKYLEERIVLLKEEINKFKDFASLKEFVKREEWWLGVIFDIDIQEVLEELEDDTSITFSDAIDFWKKRLDKIELSQWYDMKEFISFLEKFSD
ncbi:hypothetical protein A2442_02565 [Candidatus Campbellbacteria bacterium RIFOXYC2_FULL_35_25]|uniref:Uncharacterized protein n=1 Tax=Candidatus Campbellbacteria bacterium RIFOXYC2_FULL_35_25 TaxID=1797582 RepID=A0A1F5EIG1_9BACT|nr:MAG: hypothetical protein A2442_02565 [Candidatus Campbellbacteria bacterium RIFOXYC2_FULL_35_25]